MNPSNNNLDKHVERSVGLRQADVALQLDKIAKQNGLVQRLVKKTQDGTLGEQTDEQSEEADTTIHIGDTTQLMQPPASPNGGKQMAAIAAIAALSAALGLTAGSAFYAGASLNKPTTHQSTGLEYLLEFSEQP